MTPSSQVDLFDFIDRKSLNLLADFLQVSEVSAQHAHIQMQVAAATLSHKKGPPSSVGDP